jgi:hypothetical protein
VLKLAVFFELCVLKLVVNTYLTEKCHDSFDSFDVQLDVMILVFQ